MLTTNRLALLSVAGVVAAAMLLPGCKTVPPTVAPTGDVDLTAAASYLAADIAKQIGPVRNRRIVVDPLLDRSTGQQTTASARVQQAVISAFSTSTGSAMATFGADAVDQTGLVLAGSVALTPPDQFSVSVALTDRASGIVVAQSATRFRQPGLDNKPTPFYNDSPSLVRDRSVDAYLKTSETPRGNLADPLYVEQLPTAALIAAALAAYSEQKWDQALAGYTAAAARPSGQTLRTFNGIYLCNIRLGRTAAAEEAFGKIAALGLATNNLAVKLLFRPGTTEFLADAAVSGVYPMWIRQIAKAAQTSQSCLNIVGNTSRSGTEAVNDRLSLARATTVRDLLGKEAPGLDRRSRVTGVGSRRNLIGSGTDDASDALDRRVDFEVEACTAR